MEFLEIIIILGILCAQVYVAYLAWGQIESISHFLSSEKSLKLTQVTVDLNEDDEKKYVVILTPNGYKELIQKVNIPHKAIYVYASYSTLMKRLKKRNDKNDFPQRRLERDNEDFKGVEFIVDTLVYNNDGEDIDKVTEKIIKIVEG